MDWELWMCVLSLLVLLVNCFTIAVNIEPVPQNGSPTKPLISVPMRATIAMLLLVATARSTLVSQAWISQLGLEGGIVRLKPAGTHRNDPVDRWQIPSTGSPLPGLFLIVPLTGRTALESGLTASHTKFREESGLVAASSASEIRFTLRADVALVGGAYIAAGGMLRRRQINDSHSTQVGVLGAAGYQWPIGKSLHARIEAEWLSQHKTDSIAPSNAYAFLFGISRDLRSRVAQSAVSRGRFTPWRLQIGAAGGYVRTHLYGSILGLSVSARETALDFPGSGTTTPPPLFVDIPVRGRFAIEIGFAADRAQQNGATAFDGHFAPRLQVSIYHGVYAGVGGNLRYLEQTGQAGFAIAGAHVAAGYRQQVLDGLETRLDISYTVFKERSNFPFAQNSLAALLGLAVPLR